MSDYSGDDIYCDVIIPRRVEIDVFAETANVLAFHHTRPFWPTHIVVTPKHHITSLLELEGLLAAELFELVKQVARMVSDREGSAQVLTNLGADQESKHLHIHVASGEKFR